MTIDKTRQAKLGTGILKVHRSGSSLAASPVTTSFDFPVSKGMTVLDALLWVKEHVDAGLAFRYSCRMGVCGSCGMLVNGKPGLACEAQIGSLGKTVEVSPLPNFRVIRDVATDFDEFFLHHSQVKPYLVRRDIEKSAISGRENIQTEAQLQDYYEFSMCIMCGLCYSACPIASGDPDFLGPQALAQAYRFVADSRDEGARERVRIVDTVHGSWDCKVAGSCSAVCPKGVDPALGIQLLKRKILASRLHR